MEVLLMLAVKPIMTYASLGLAAKDETGDRCIQTTQGEKVCWKMVSENHKFEMLAALISHIS